MKTGPAASCTERRARRQPRGRRRRRAVRRRVRQRGVARLHESRARSAGLRRPNQETRKVREQVCARRAAETRYARISRISKAACRRRRRDRRPMRTCRAKRDWQRRRRDACGITDAGDNRRRSRATVELAQRTVPPSQSGTIGRLNRGRSPDASPLALRFARRCGAVAHEALLRWSPRAPSV